MAVDKDTLIGRLIDLGIYKVGNQQLYELEARILLKILFKFSKKNIDIC